MTQHLVAKSSAEAPFDAAARVAYEASGIQTLFFEFGEQFQTRVFIDVAAAKSIIERNGVGKVRHIDVQLFWLQEH